MARLFDDASNEYLEIDSAPATAAPLTMACWVYPDDLSANQSAMGLADQSVGNRYYNLLIRSSDVIRFDVRSATSLSIDTTTTATVNTWHHICGVDVSATDHSVFLDGGGEGNSITSSVPTGIDRISIGRLGDLSPAREFSGRIAEPAIWTAALSNAEVALLAKGFSPLFIRPESLVAYWPLIRDDDQDRMGDFNLSAFNTPSVAEHPPNIIYPAPPFISYPVAAAPAGNAMPMAMNTYRQMRVRA